MERNDYCHYKVNEVVIRDFKGQNLVNHKTGTGVILLNASLTSPLPNILARLPPVHDAVKENPFHHSKLQLVLN